MVEAFDCLLRAKVTYWLRISWSAPAAFKTFRTCSSLLCSLPSLISNGVSPLFGTQGKSRRLQSLSVTRNRGHGMAFVPRRAPQGPAWLQSPFSLVLLNLESTQNCRTERG